MVLRLGLTGGIGSGKSTAAAMFVDLGAELIDADALARDVVAPGSAALAAIADRFGSSVLYTDDDGKVSLDRAALGQRVFSDEQAREAVNAIVHPHVRRRSEELIEQIAARDPSAVVVQDIPLLLEAGRAADMHLVVVVTASEQIRINRAVQRGMEATDVRSRITAQATDAERMEIADLVLDNNGTEEQLRDQVRTHWHERVQPFGRDLAAGC